MLPSNQPTKPGGHVQSEHYPCSRVRLGDRRWPGHCQPRRVAPLGRVGGSSGADEGPVGRTVAPLSRRRRRRDPGVTLTHLAVLLADGGDALSDLAVLRNEPELFGTVASDATAFRLLHSGYCPEAIDQARAVARERAWAAGAAPESVTLDIDATLVDAHSEKEDAAPTYKGGFGFSPMVCFVRRDQRGPGRGAAAGQRLAPSVPPTTLTSSSCSIDQLSGRLAARARGGGRRGAPPPGGAHRLGRCFPRVRRRLVGPQLRGLDRPAG